MPMSSNNSLQAVCLKVPPFSTLPPTVAQFFALIELHLYEKIEKVKLLNFRVHDD